MTDTVDLLQEEQFQDTYGHPIQRGNLKTPLKNQFEA